MPKDYDRDGIDYGNLSFFTIFSVIVGVCLGTGFGSLAVGVGVSTFVFLFLAVGDSIRDLLEEIRNLLEDLQNRRGP